MKWFDALEVLWGVRLDADGVRKWEYYLRKSGTNGDDLCRIIETASEYNLSPRGYRVTAADLMRWVEQDKHGGLRPKGVSRASMDGIE